MSPFLFIWRRSLLNFIRQLPKKPGRFMLVLVYASFFVLAIMSVTFMPRTAGSVDITTSETGFGLYNLVWLALVLLFGGSILYYGTSKGSAVFSGADVQFLFPAPYKPQSILLYGLVGMLKAMGVVAVFLPFQFPNLSRLGLSVGQLFLLILVFVWSLICFNLFSVVLYLLGQHRTALRKLLRASIIAVPALLVILLVFPALTARDYPSLLTVASDTPWLRLVPFFGWTLALAQAVIRGLDTYSLIALICMILTPFATFWIAYRIPADFFEDAIVQVEKAKEQKARMEGRRQTAATARQKKYKGSNGIRHGAGLATLFFRHFRETRRKRPLFVSIAGIALLAVMVLILVPLRAEQDVRQFSIYFLLMLPMLQIFLRGKEEVTTAELSRPLIYLLPYRPGQKLFWLVLTELVFNLPQVLPSLLFFVIWMQPQAGQLLALMPFLFVYPLTLTASEVLTFRIMGSTEGQLSSIVQMFTAIPLLAPSASLLIIAAVRDITLGISPTLFFLLAAVLQIAVGGTIVFFAGRSALDSGLVKA